MTVQLIQFCHLLYTITTKLLSKHCIKRVLDTERNGYHCFNFTEKTFLRTVDPNQPKNFKFSLWSIIDTFPKRGAWLFRAGAKILSGGAKRSQWRCKTNWNQWELKLVQGTLLMIDNCDVFYFSRNKNSKLQRESTELEKHHKLFLCTVWLFVIQYTIHLNHKSAD